MNFDHKDSHERASRRHRKSRTPTKPAELHALMPPLRSHEHQGRDTKDSLRREAAGLIESLTQLYQTLLSEESDGVMHSQIVESHSSASGESVSGSRLVSHVSNSNNRMKPGKLAARGERDRRQQRQQTLSPLKRKPQNPTPLNIEDLEALSKLAPGVPLSELLSGMGNFSGSDDRTNRKTRRELIEIDEDGPATFDRYQGYRSRTFALSKISEVDNDTKDDGVESSRFNTANKNSRARRRPMSAGRRRRGGFNAKTRRKKKKRPKSARRARPQCREKKHGQRHIYHGASNKNQASISNNSDVSRMLTSSSQKKVNQKSKRQTRPRSAPMSRKRKQRTLSDVEEDAARREILELAGAPPTHDEKVQRLHKYTWNQFRPAHVDGASILPPGRRTANEMAISRKATSQRLEELANPRGYRLRQKITSGDNPPFRTSGGKGLLAELGYVTGLGSSRIGIGKEATSASAIDPSKPRSRFAQLATSGSDIASRITNYNLLEHHPEYQNLQEGEVCVVILQCSHCHRHQRTTRHKEDVFEAKACKMELALREVLPTTSVVVRKKVGLRLIGALEVQICRRRQNKLEKRLLHSRIITGAWPNTKQVAQRAATFLPAFTLSLTCETKCDNLLAHETSAAFQSLLVSLLSETGEIISKCRLVEDGFEPSLKRHEGNTRTYASCLKIELCSIDVARVKNLVVEADNTSDQLFVPIKEHLDLSSEKTFISFKRVLCRRRRFLVTFAGPPKSVSALTRAADAGTPRMEFDVKDLSSEGGSVQSFKSAFHTGPHPGSYQIFAPMTFFGSSRIQVAILVRGKEAASSVFDAKTGLRRLEESFLQMSIEEIPDFF